MTFGDEALNRLVPPTLAWKPDWANVLERAGELNRRQWQPRARRRLILALAALAVVLIPLIALAAENDWWFFG
jgi:hypothetical protein